ncbi:GNAT family N-acetyltransferase [Arenibacter lacus]|uniref:GNAT family N-acetyltransferase n=1 Tax=Arenibacter lacus TaxID=2608629 RepID=UPI00123CD59C|nr:GNAT family N-acetyltransferase [Arenibacter lacus]
MNNNPFSSKTYTTTWLQHFRPSAQISSFPFLKGISFYKHPFLPLYTNVGRNMTKGMWYSLENEKINREVKNKVLLIYDVPEQAVTTDGLASGRLKREKIIQYPGFLLDLAPFKDYNDYLLQTFSKSSRYKLNKYIKRLETCFDIRYKMYHGEIKKEEYYFVFEHFEALLRKRFLQKQITNNNLEPKEWNFYKEATYPMILEKDAALFVVYNGKTPIAVTLNYIQNNALIDAITVFDIDFEKFNLGSINIMKLVEWSLDNNLGVFDFSKGYYEYKKRWTNKAYNFEYHLLYDGTSPLSTLLAWNIKNYFKLKQYLREKDLNTKFHKLSFLLKNNKSVKDEKTKFTFSPMEERLVLENYKEVTKDSSEWNQLRTMIFEFLYLNSEAEKDLTIKQHTNNSFIFIGKKERVLLSIL